MFVGHAAVAALAGTLRPDARLLPLVVASYGADLLEIALHAAGVDHQAAMFWSHSLVAVAGAALAAGGVTLVTWRDPRYALLVVAAYVSHWGTDLLTGEGKPTWAGGPLLGLGLYEHPALDFAIEATLVLAAAALHHWRRPQRARRTVLVAAVLVALQLGFNLSDREGMRGLKQDLVRAGQAAGAAQ